MERYVHDGRIMVMVFRGRRILVFETMNDADSLHLLLEQVLSCSEQNAVALAHGR